MKIFFFASSSLAFFFSSLQTLTKLVYWLPLEDFTAAAATLVLTKPQRMISEKEEELLSSPAARATWVLTIYGLVETACLILPPTEILAALMRTSTSPKIAGSKRESRRPSQIPKKRISARQARGVP